MSTASVPSQGDKPARRRSGQGLAWIACGVFLALAGAGAYALAHPEAAPAPVGALVEDLTGANPHPVHLLRPQPAPLSALASLGRELFYDPALSGSGRLACASCHSPQHAYGPPNGLSVQFGGPLMNEAGLRPPPSLAYLYRQLPFSIGPEAADTEVAVNLNQVAAQAQGTVRAAKTAGAAPAAPAMVPQGGLFWDGRDDTLQLQAMGPLMNPAEMANTSQDQVARQLAQPKYADQLKRLFGPYVLNDPGRVISEAMSAIARYQIEDPSFHRFDSKYDAWLEGKARLSPAELRGMRLFNDPAKANCGGCHLSQAGKDGLPPLFTDTQYEALGVPRNAGIPANKDPRFFDLGLCGPIRTDLARQTQYCGMFLTPTLRNSVSRGVYFHNGAYHQLKQVLDFYNLRNTDPGRIYPRDAAGRVAKYDDIPPPYRANVDVADAPFDRKPGDKPAMSDRDIQDIIAFLKTLDDGYRPHGS